mmetsp:Transcript_12621/g.32425  ORF Transcript_12621/g.32425 Transcript_12621/m.32425 type:complete len:83 (+) Transcript_12621:3-251(+)
MAVELEDLAGAPLMAMELEDLEGGIAESVVGMCSPDGDAHSRDAAVDWLHMDFDLESDGMPAPSAACKSVFILPMRTGAWFS